MFLDGYHIGVVTQIKDLDNTLKVSKRLVRIFSLRNSIRLFRTFTFRHDYAADYDETFVYSYDGLCDSISVTFSEETETEEDADFIELYDKDDVLTGRYSGTGLAGKTLTVKGNTVKIRLISDSTLQAYGFKTKEIVVNR